jgi:hypothetical protein
MTRPAGGRKAWKSAVWRSQAREPNSARLMHLGRTMLDEAVGTATSELPLDFTQFLSQRLHLEPPATLAVLGSFLLTFEPSTSCRRLTGDSTSSPHSNQNI